MPTLSEILNELNRTSGVAGAASRALASARASATLGPTALGQAGGAATVAATGTDLTLEVELDRRARALADEIIRQRDAAARLASFGRIFTQFQEGDVVANQQETVTKGIFSGDVGSLTTFFSSSTQTSTQKRYYYEVFQSASTAVGAAPQFSVAYGHRLGSGSADEGGQVNDTPSKAVYSQYRLILLEPNDEKFSIGGTDTDHIYIINFNRARMRERIDEGNIEINIAPLSGSAFANNVHTGSNVRIDLSAGARRPVRLIDDSSIANASVGQAGKKYNLVSGSIENGVHNSSAPHYYGLVYPQMGIAVIDANALNRSASFNTVTGSEVAGDNAFKLFVALSGAAANFTDGSGDALALAARNSEQVKSTHYFVRVKNGEYNFSNNPTFVTGSNGDINQPTFIKDPKTYITTVGLYNDRQEMLAVAKLSKPLLKSFTREALIKVKLDF
jgi:hypothetical protein